MPSTATASKKTAPAGAVRIAAAKKASAASTAKPAAAAKPAVKKSAATATPAKKPAAGEKKAAPKRAATLRSAAITPEQRYCMVAEAAYYRAEQQGFMGDPVQDWIAAEAEIEALLRGGK